MARLFFAAALLVLSTAATCAFAQDRDVRPLAMGTPVTDSLSSADLHTYVVDLETSQFVVGAADQHTVDVVVTIYAPDGSIVTKVDGPEIGPDVFQFETKAAGEYRVEVAPFENAQGRYTMALTRVEPLATTPAGRVDQLMAAYSGSDVPGGVIAVIENGRIVFSNSYGMANLTHAVPFEVDTRTNIGSTSKQFTAFAIALLAQQGKLSLDDDVRKHIPELPDFEETVTLRHLLTHTSGYREFLNTLALSGRRLGDGDYVDREELIEIVQRQPALQNDPGAEWNYNNTGFGLLTVVVERVTGEPFPQWMKKNVFEPLGMTNTYVRSHQAEIIPNSAQGYLPEEDGGGYRIGADLGAAMGAGGIYTTVEDLAKWMRNLDTAELGGKDLIAEMTTPYVLTTGDTTNYGLGLFIDEQRGLIRIQHGGADIAHRSMLMYFPKIDAGVVALSNNASFGGSIPTKIAEEFFKEHMTWDADDETSVGPETAEFDPARYDPSDFDAYAGKYELEAVPGFILSFTRQDSTLYTQATGQPRAEIVATSDSTFKLLIVDASVTFHRDADGVVKRLTLHQNGHHVAHRLEEESQDAEELQAYTGTYFSEELETYYTLVVEDSALLVQHRRFDDVKLAPTKHDAFSGSFPLGDVAFERDESGTVTGFTVGNGRTRGVRFEKMD